MVWVWLAVAILLVLAMDRFLLWAEGRGWVYWRRQRVRSGGGVFGELIQVFQPSHQFVVEDLYGSGVPDLVRQRHEILQGLALLFDPPASSRGHVCVLEPVMGPHHVRGYLASTNSSS